MSSAKNTYIHNIKWSAIESIIFQFFLCIHQYALFITIEPKMYGIIGTIFGIIYFIVKLIDLGLSRLLVSFFVEYSISQKSFFSFFNYQIIPTCIAYCVIILCNTCGTFSFLEKLLPSTFNKHILLIIL